MAFAGRVGENKRLAAPLRGRQSWSTCQVVQRTDSPDSIARSIHRVSEARDESASRSLRDPLHHTVGGRHDEERSGRLVGRRAEDTAVQDPEIAEQTSLSATRSGGGADSHVLELSVRVDDGRRLGTVSRLCRSATKRSQAQALVGTADRRGRLTSNSCRLIQLSGFVRSHTTSHTLSVGQLALSGLRVQLGPDLNGRRLCQ